MRTQTHIIDSRAVKAVMAQLPDHWVVRELTERDYGIDLMVEIFAPGLKDANGKDAFAETGAVFHIQIKGTQEPLKPVCEGTVNYSIDKKSLYYVEKFSTPFFLFRVSVSDPQTVLFLWIQDYIKNKMDYENPMWREEAEATVTVRIPPKNVLPEGIQRIEKIAFQPKLLEELIEFSEIHLDIGSRIEAIRADMHYVDQSVLDNLKNRAYRVRRLNVLLTQNDCCIDKGSVDRLIEYIGRLNTTEGRRESPPELDNFENLAQSSLSLASVRAFDLGNAGLTTY